MDKIAEIRKHLNRPLPFPRIHEVEPQEIDCCDSITTMLILAGTFERINILTKANRLYMIGASMGWTIGQLKRAFERMTGIPDDHQRFFFRCKHLLDNVTLKDAGLYDDCTLHLDLVLRSD